LYLSCRRLQERYSLCAQLFAHQEALLPGRTAQLLLLLNLQLHGTAALLGLLQDMQLTITAHTSEGGPVTQVRWNSRAGLYQLCSLACELHGGTCCWHHSSIAQQSTRVPPPAAVLLHRVVTVRSC
jgi:hypothetical protein